MTQWVLYDDPASERLRPFTWLRPASALLLGTETIEARWRRLAGAGGLVQVVCRNSTAQLASDRIDFHTAASKISRQSAAPGDKDRGDRDPGDKDATAGSSVWVSDRLIPDSNLAARLAELPPDSLARCAGALVAFRPGPAFESLLVGVVSTNPAGRESERQHDDRESTEFLVFADLRSFRGVLERIEQEHAGAFEVEAMTIDGLGDLVRLQEGVLSSDLDRCLSLSPAPERCGDGFAYKLDAIRLDPATRIDHGAVLDAREGPIVLEAGCHVFPHTWIRGPFYAAAGCMLLGGRIGGGTSLGPGCRIRGEVEASVVLGWSNKAHDGFLGHSYVGEWVNLGALTTNSDLKNNYSLVTLQSDEQKEPTGIAKVGVFLGDHVKTRIGCLLNCGTIIGIGASLAGEPAISARWVPDFSWGSGAGTREYEINKFLHTAETVFGRRGVRWTPAVASVLREVHEATRAARQRGLGAIGAARVPSSRENGNPQVP